ncbi:MAG: hypothetical protein H6Q52_1275, partial [Deltaproteobacteria bacterium]|nr:hypothetical protein [Deltaproteobacteria bacterium]
MPPFELLKRIIPVITAHDRRRPQVLPVVLCVFIICLFGIFHPYQASGKDNDLARDLRAIISDPAIGPAKIGI